MCGDADCIPQLLETKFKHLGVFYHEHWAQAFKNYILSFLMHKFTLQMNRNSIL